MIIIKQRTTQNILKYSITKIQTFEGAAPNKQFLKNLLLAYQHTLKISIKHSKQRYPKKFLCKKRKVISYKRQKIIYPDYNLRIK